MITSTASSPAIPASRDPCLIENQKVIGTPEGFYDKDDPYYFPDAMADNAIKWIHGVRAQDAEKPFFMYFSTGCSHAPHHVANSWADKYKGKFDQGWDKLREETFARQKALGVVPSDAVLTERDPAFPAWADVPDKLKGFYARQMEVYAGFSENADYNVGRVIDAIDELGDLDNTMIVWIWGDNGASMEGTVTGSFNEMTMQNGIPLTDEMQLQLVERFGGMDEWGGQIMDPHYGAAWAWAGNTPFKWGKQVGSHLGGTRNPMVLSWPGHVDRVEEVRSQFTHVIDVAPTILAAAGIPEPKSVDGIEQEPMHGVDFGAAFANPSAPEYRTQQYFETIGNRGMYKDGWWLAMKTERIPWVITPEALKPYAPGVWDPDAGPAELYYLPDDFTQANDVSAENPEKVLELKALFWEDAERYKVLPLLATLSTFFGMLPPMPEKSTFEFRGDVEDVLSGMIPRIYNHSYSISADLGGTGRRSGGRHRRGKRSSRRVHALCHGRQAHSHVFDDGCVLLQASGRRGPALRRRERSDGVRSRRSQAGDRRRGDPVHQRQTCRQGAHGTHRTDPLLGLRRHGHRSWTMAAWSTWPTRAGSHSRSPAQ